MDKKRIKAGEDLLTGSIYKAERYKEPEQAVEGEEGIDYGLIILPPKEGATSPELDSYPADYIEYAQERLRAYKREHGELPQYDYSGCIVGLHGEAGGPVDSSQLVDREATEEIDRRAGDTQRELQRQAEEADEAIRGTL